LTQQQRTQLQDQARQLLTEAEQGFQENRQRLAEAIKNYNVDSQDPASAQRLEELRNEYVRVRMASPVIAERLADSYDPSDPQRKPLLERAAQEFLDIAKDYRRRPGGLDAALYAARCLVKLQRFDEAMVNLLDIFDQDSRDPKIVNIQKQGALLAIECWAAEDPYPYNEAVEYLAPIVERMMTHEVNDPGWVRVQLALAEACYLKAAALREQGVEDAEQRRQLNQLEDTATKLARQVARTTGEHRVAADALLKKLGERVAEREDNAAEPTTPAEMLARGKQLLADADDLQRELDSLTSSAADPATDESQALRQRYRELVREALNLFRTAQRLSTSDTPRDEITNLQYLQAVAFYRLDRFPEAAIIGRWLVDRYPGNLGSRQAAALVCQSFWQMYSAAAPQNAFEREQLLATCQLTIDKWPNTSEAETAARLLTIVALKEDDLAAAEANLKLIPTDSPGQATLTHSVGQLLWQAFRRAKSELPPGATMSAEQAALADRARGYLEAGLAAADPGHLTTADAWAALALTELLLEQGDVAAALEQLENAPVAPLDLVKQKHAAAAEGDFRREAMRAAVRVYLAAMQRDGQAEPWSTKAQGVLDALQTELSASPEGQQQIVGIYYTLAKELKSHFDQIPELSQRATFARQLDVFLEPLMQTTNRPLQFWVGSLYNELGDALNSGEAAGEARALFNKGLGVFDAMVAELGRDPSADAVLVMQVRRQRAMALRGLGRYEEAVHQFGDLLADPAYAAMVDLQVDAAATYQAWGESAQNAEPLARAIMGGESRPDAKTQRERLVIWGWSRLAKAARASQRDDIFAQSLYNLARCKWHYGRIKNSRETTESALKEITNFEANSPEMGGPEWKQRFAELAQLIEQDLAAWPADVNK
jgi:hypothetical protein